MANVPLPPGVIGPQPGVTPTQGGIGMPARMIYERPMWDSPAVQSPARNLPAPGDRLRARGLNAMSGGGSAGASGASSLLAGTQLVRERHRYAEVIETPWSVGVTSVKVLTQPSGLRNFLLLRNISTGAQIIFVSLGNTATLQSSLRLASNQAILLDAVVPQNELNAISDLAGGALMVAYSQYAPL